jgi:hypothetical protein
MTKGATMKTAAATLAVLATAALAACGGGGGGSDQASTSTSSDQGPTRITLTDEQRACLEKNGASIPSGPPAGGTTTQTGPPPGASGAPPAGGSQTFQRGNPQDFAKMQKAAKKCGVDLPQGGPGGDPPDVNSEQFQASVSDYATCMSDNGYTMPAPDFSGNGPVFDESKVDRSDPKFTAASAKCQNKLAPQGGMVQIGPGPSS